MKWCFRTKRLAIVADHYLQFERVQMLVDFLGASKVNIEDLNAMDLMEVSTVLWVQDAGNGED